MVDTETVSNLSNIYGFNCEPEIRLYSTYKLSF